MKKATTKKVTSKKVTSKKSSAAATAHKQQLMNAVKLDGAIITDTDGCVSVRKAYWHESDVISEKPQVIPGRLVCSGAEYGRGDWLDFKPYSQGKREKPFTEILKTKHGVVRTSKRTVQVNYAFSKDMSKDDIRKCLMAEHKQVATTLKGYAESVDWEAYKE